MAWENYGLAYVVDQRVGLDREGNIVAWDCETWSPVRDGRPGEGNPGNVVTGFLVGFEPAAFTPRSPAPDPESFNNSSNGVPSYVQAAWEGKVEARAAWRASASYPTW